MVQAARVT